MIKGEKYFEREVKDFLIFGNILVLLSIDGCQIEFFDVYPHKNQITPRKHENLKIPADWGCDNLIKIHNDHIHLYSLNSGIVYIHDHIDLKETLEFELDYIPMKVLMNKNDHLHYFYNENTYKIVICNSYMHNSALELKYQLAT